MSAQLQAGSAPAVDPVTGLGSRAAMFVDLERVLREGRHSSLAVFALDGSDDFRRDAGEAASNGALAVLAAEFGRVTGPAARCYTPRRHEFCAIFDLPFEKASPLLAAASIAIRREGELFGISSVFGVTMLPEEASTPIEALVVADKRLNAARRLR